jgi:hypothetical protein
MIAADQRNLNSACAGVSGFGGRWHQKKRWNLVRYKFTNV